MQQLTGVNRGFFGKGDMQKEFEEAAFALQPGEMSGVVQTASGLHLIQRLVCLCFHSFAVLLTRPQVGVGQGLLTFGVAVGLTGTNAAIYCMRARTLDSISSLVWTILAKRKESVVFTNVWPSVPCVPAMPNDKHCKR